MRNRFFWCGVVLGMVGNLGAALEPEKVAEDSTDFAPLFPFVISYDAPENVTNLSFLLDAPAGKHGFVRVEKGHFVTDAGRIRFHAVNTSGPANFPTHEQADRVADRLARFGINCVRMHFVEGSFGTFRLKRTPGLVDTTRPGRHFDMDRLDRLDYFIAALKKRGIYVNMNLTTSRIWDEMKGGMQGGAWLNKGVDNFYKPLIDSQKDYASRLFNHVNPYTKLRYADDPVFAMVEINNENSLWSTYSWNNCGSSVKKEPFRSDFQRQWNEWLRKKYETQANLEKAWNVQETRQPQVELVPEGNFQEPIVIDGKKWRWVTDTADASLETKEGTLQMEVKKRGEGTYPRLFRALSLQAGETYTLSFQIRQISGQSNAQVLLAVAEGAYATWRQLGVFENISVGKEWKTYTYTLQAAKDSPEAKIQWTVWPEGKFEMRNLSFRQGPVPFQMAGSLEKGDIPLIFKNTAAPMVVKQDMAEFLCDTEITYWYETMYRFLKEEVKLKAPVAGTQLGYTPAFVQAKLDYVDKHDYWLHPHVGDDWSIENRAMVNADGGCMASIANLRVYGKPYTISEYNNSYPNMYGAEGQAMLRAYGAFQDWDGVFAYTYHHNTDEPQALEYFFSIACRTDVLAHMPACAAIYLRGDVRKAEKSLVAAYDHEKFMNQLAKTCDTNYSIGNDGYDSRNALVHQVSVDLENRDCTKRSEIAPISGNVYTSDTGELCWNREKPEESYWTVNTANTKLFSGFPAGRSFDLGGVGLKIGKTRLDWTTISLFSRQGNGFGEHGKSNILLTATGFIGNQGVKIQDLGGKRIRFSDWGTAPVMAEGISAEVTLPVAAEKVRCWALDCRGDRKTELPVEKTTDGQAKILLSPQYQTVWYEIEVE
ncbi:MAG: carbohydrate binding domain-containing protein [Planctomycetia bacterium]|nr:carbohydrate binding domain-containing protein [Planctomycetia bacterium]